MAEGFLLGPGLLARTRRAVETVEGMPIGAGFRDSQVLLEGEQPARIVFRICEFTGAWSIGQQRAIKLKYIPGATNTVNVTNLVCGMNPGSTPCDVSIAKEGTAWFLIQPNLTQLPGYSASGTQVLTVVGGNLRWIGTTAC